MIVRCTTEICPSPNSFRITTWSGLKIGLTDVDRHASFRQFGRVVMSDHELLLDLERIRDTKDARDLVNHLTDLTLKVRRVTDDSKMRMTGPSRDRQSIKSRRLFNAFFASCVIGKRVHIRFVDSNGLEVNDPGVHPFRHIRRLIAELLDHVHEGFFAHISDAVHASAIREQHYSRYIDQLVSCFMEPDCVLDGRFEDLLLEIRHRQTRTCAHRQGKSRRYELSSHLRYNHRIQAAILQILMGFR